MFKVKDFVEQCSINWGGGGDELTRFVIHFALTEIKPIMKKQEIRIAETSC
jgi:hypothetical protein